MSKWAKPIIGKTIKAAEITKTGASDGCFFAILEFEFTDGSGYSMRIHAQPEVHGIFFESHADAANATEATLVRP